MNDRLAAAKTGGSCSASHASFGPTAWVVSAEPLRQRRHLVHRARVDAVQDRRPKGRAEGIRQDGAWAHTAHARGDHRHVRKRAELSSDRAELVPSHLGVHSTQPGCGRGTRCRAPP